MFKKVPKPSRPDGAAPGKTGEMAPRGPQGYTAPPAAAGSEGARRPARRHPMP